MQNSSAMVGGVILGIVLLMGWFAYSWGGLIGLGVYLTCCIILIICAG